MLLLPLLLLDIGTPLVAAAGAAASAATMSARHEIVREADAPAARGDTFFRDFGAVSMYDAIAQFDPMVPACGGAAPPWRGQESCCGDGTCQQRCLGRGPDGGNCVGGHETPQNCPTDCPADGAATSARRQFRLSTPEPQDSSLFPGLLSSIEHPEFHCHSETSSDYDVYDDPQTQPRWFLGRPSKELSAFFANQQSWSGQTQAPLIAPGTRGHADLTALDLGCGDGRDTRFLASLGFRATGVDVSVPSIRQALRLRAEDSMGAAGLAAAAEALPAPEYVLYDALQLPAPTRPLDFIWDNTIYCNLRLEYLGQVTALLARLTAPGSLYFLNCGNAAYPQVIAGHPRLFEASIRAELGGLFEFLVFREGVYDMNLLTTDDGKPALEAWPELEREWEWQQQGVHGWAVLMRRRGGGSSDRAEL